MNHPLPRVASLLGLLVLSTCGPSSAESPARGHDAVFGGVVDSAPEEFPSVVSFTLSGQGRCTASVVHRDATSAWLLTAAHCVVDSDGALFATLPIEVAFGANVATAAKVRLAALETRIHPRFVPFAAPGDSEVSEPLAHDVALLRVTGLSSSLNTAVAPFAEGTAVTAGAAVSFAGFGPTQPGAAPAEQRYRAASVVERVLAVDGAAWALLPASGPGFCSGDSGGPLARGAGGGPREIIGVISSARRGVQTSCAGGGVAWLLDASDVAFINDAIAGSSPPAPETCASAVFLPSLGGGACIDQAGALRRETSLASFLGCYRANTWASCALDFPTVPPLLEAYWACLEANVPACTGSMRARLQCSSQSSLPGPVENACTQCVVKSCCEVGDRCGGNETCRACRRGTTMGAACEGDADYAAFSTCMRASCATACSGAFVFEVPQAPDAGTGVMPPPPPRTGCAAADLSGPFGLAALLGLRRSRRRRVGARP